MGPVIPALLVAIHLGGGTYAYVKKSSVQSFLGGLVAGGAYIYSTFAFATSRVHSGAIVGFYNAVCMGSLMGLRFNRTQVMMPAGALALVNILAGAYFYYEIQRSKIQF